MALLEQIKQMKQQGMSDQEIYQNLQEQGISPRQINEAFSQSMIKSAVAVENQEEMQQSVMYPPQQQVTQQQVEEISVPAQNQQYAQYPEQGNYANYDENADQSQYAPQEGYGGETYYQQALDIETVRDISQQVVDESLNKIKDQIKEFTKLKTELKFQIQNLDNRLTRIESTMSQLQSDILKKIGEYGENIASISQEMKATQENFSKMINPVLDEKRKVETKMKKEPVSRPSSPRTPGFESFLR